MNKLSIVFASFVLVLVTAACSGSSSPDDGSTTSATRLALDVRCAVDTDCPAGFECELEVEHGVSTSFCTTHGGNGMTNGAPAASTTSCPVGFELELEHGASFCKAHGGADPVGAVDDKGGSGGGSSSPTPTPTPTPAPTAASSGGCRTDSDCAAGLECEVEVEGGITTSRCKAHGGK